MMVAQRLKAARTACKLTQNQVAEILGIDRSAYTYYETGKTSPSLPNLQRLASLFKVDVAWLLSDLSERQESPVLSSSGDAFTLQKEIAERRLNELSKEERQIVAFYRMLCGEGKREEALGALRQIRDAASDSGEPEQGAGA